MKEMMKFRGKSAFGAFLLALLAPALFAAVPLPEEEAEKLEDYLAEIDAQAGMLILEGPDISLYNYPHDIEKDRAAFDPRKIDIIVGNRLYMTQINDWFLNFDKYAGKSVEIEGFYMDFDGFTYVGRKGPICLFCTGGYVNFEFKYDRDLSALQSEKSWVKVRGILREGSVPSVFEKGTMEPFYYIEAITVEKMPKVGKATVRD